MFGMKLCDTPLTTVFHLVQEKGEESVCWRFGGWYREYQTGNSGVPINAYIQS
jgi:hypothetical protein